MSNRKSIPQPNRAAPSSSAVPKPEVHKRLQGLSPEEIRLRLHAAGFTIPQLAKNMRRSAVLVHMVIRRERRSHHVETVIAKVLAWQGLTRGDVWGPIWAPADEESSNNSLGIGTGEVE